MKKGKVLDILTYIEREKNTVCIWYRSLPKGITSLYFHKYIKYVKEALQELWSD